MADLMMSAVENDWDRVRRIRHHIERMGPPQQRQLEAERWMRLNNPPAHIKIWYDEQVRIREERARERGPEPLFCESTEAALVVTLRNRQRMGPR